MIALKKNVEKEKWFWFWPWLLHPVVPDKTEAGRSVNIHDSIWNEMSVMFMSADFFPWFYNGASVHIRGFKFFHLP